jgi:hypothetical protein
MTKQTFEEFQAEKSLPIWQVIDCHTRTRVGPPMKCEAARRKRDRLDLEYGAVRYAIEQVRS